MHIDIGNIYSKVVDCSNAELSFLIDILQVTVPNHQHMPSFKSGNWDGKKNFFSIPYRTFLSGFMPFVLREIRKRKFTLTISDKRQNTQIGDPTSFKVRYPKLRDYQVDALQKVFTTSLRFDNTVIPWQRGIIKIQTGGGKTFVAACLTDFLKQKTLYVVDRRNLAHQTLKEFQSVTKMSVGILGDGLHQLDADITIAMIQTLKNVYNKRSFQKYLSNVGVVIVDECHKLSKGMYHKFMVKCPAYFRIGLSGTPLSRGDLGDLTLIADTGELLVETDREMLENEGFLAKPKVFMFASTQPNGIGFTYRRAYQELLVHNDIRNSMIIQAVQKLLKKDCNILILVSEISHGKILLDMLKSSKIKSVYVRGEDSSAARQKAIDAVGKSYKVMIASRIFDEGMDAPKLNAVIMAGGGASSIKTVQRVGRVARPKPGENICYVVDFLDKNNAYLLKHSATRITTYETEGFTVRYPNHV